MKLACSHDGFNSLSHLLKNLFCRAANRKCVIKLNFKILKLVSFGQTCDATSVDVVSRLILLGLPFPMCAAHLVSLFGFTNSVVLTGFTVFQLSD